MRPRALLGRGLSDTVDQPWFDDPAQGGSQILERASHLIDLERDLAGEVERVSGMERSGIASLSLEFDSETLGTVVVGRVPDGPGWSLEIVCDDQMVGN
jgi:predicted dehydrogenase